jgi:hypothetical protein
MNEHEPGSVATPMLKDGGPSEPVAVVACEPAGAGLLRADREVVLPLPCAVPERAGTSWPRQDRRKRGRDVIRLRAGEKAAGFEQPDCLGGLLDDSVDLIRLREPDERRAQ